MDRGLFQDGFVTFPTDDNARIGGVGKTRPDFWLESLFLAETVEKADVNDQTP